MAESTMFLSNISVVDHAYIDDMGMIIGGSYNPSFLVTGKVTDDESVVIDFSTGKKALKKIIDHDVYGFDHKLWLIEGFSNVSTVTIVSSAKREYLNKQFLAISDPRLKQYMEESEKTMSMRSDVVRITSRAFEIDVPRDAIKWVQNLKPSKDLQEIVTEALVALLEEKLQAEADYEVSLECKLEITEHVYNQHVPTAPFRYTHGLKFSTSWGCQNIAHGHLSYMQLIFDDMTKTIRPEYVNAVAKEFENVVFVFKENVIAHDDKHITIQYRTNRGHFRAKYNLKRFDIRLLDTETTVEYLVDHISKCDAVQSLLKEGLKELYVSEGLSKGAMKRF